MTKNFAPTWLRWSTGACLLIGMVATACAAEPASRPVIGWVENVGLDEADTILKARIDTGAGLASVNAKILKIEPATAEGPERVRFRILGGNGESTPLERPVLKWVSIKKKGESGISGDIRRPVVELHFCLGGKWVEARANLADRTGFLYPLLIGRNVLKAGTYMIDPTRTFTHPAHCDRRG